MSRFWPRFLGSCSPRKGKSIRFPLLNNCICDGKLEDILWTEDLQWKYVPGPLPIILPIHHPPTCFSVSHICSERPAIRKPQRKAKFCEVFQSISKGFGWNFFFLIFLLWFGQCSYFAELKKLKQGWTRFILRWETGNLKAIELTGKLKKQLSRRPTTSIVAKETTRMVLQSHWINLNHKRCFSLPLLTAGLTVAALIYSVFTFLKMLDYHWNSTARV